MEKKTTGKKYYFFIILSLIISVGNYYVTKKITNSIIIFFSVIFLFGIFSFFKRKLEESAEIRKMEEVFPDFIELVASNLRAGMTLDKALLLSSRKEFSPLDSKILIMGKEIMTGKEISNSLIDLGKRTKSDKIKKTIDLIVSGLKSGGNIAILLEETAINMRERSFVEKKAASNVLMYIILISFTIAVGAPALFALSTVLVSIMGKILIDIPSEGIPLNLPFSLSQISISSEFVTNFSIVFLILISIISSLLLGLIMKNDEKEGLRYAPIFISVSLLVFLLLKTVLLRAMANLFG